MGSGELKMQEFKTELTKEKIDEIFERCKNSDDVVVELYRTVIPIFDEIDKVNGFPKANDEVNKYIMRKMINLDEKNKVNHMKGGRWFNNGFSTDNTLEDWIVVYRH